MSVKGWNYIRELRELLSKIDMLELLTFFFTRKKKKQHKLQHGKNRKSIAYFFLSSPKENISVTDMWSYELQSRTSWNLKMYSKFLRYLVICFAFLKETNQLVMRSLWKGWGKYSSELDLFPRWLWTVLFPLMKHEITFNLFCSNPSYINYYLIVQLDWKTVGGLTFRILLPLSH